MKIHSCAGCSKAGKLYIALGGHSGYASKAYLLKGVHKAEIYDVALLNENICPYCGESVVSKTKDIELCGVLTNTQVAETIKQLDIVVKNLQVLGSDVYTMKDEYSEEVKSCFKHIYERFMTVV